MRYIIPISGKDSLAVAIIQRSIAPELDYEYVFNETGAETPEVYEWLKQVESTLNIKIRNVGDSLEDWIEEYGILPSVKARYCTRKVKIEPFEDFVGKDQATCYYGIRADERRAGYDNTKRPNIIPAYPLIGANIDLHGVWDIVLNSGCPPPVFFWQDMYNRVAAGLGDYCEVLEGLDKQTHVRLFAGRSRANCFFCFFQRTYEWVWLAETHPTLFDRACQLEETIGGDSYTWRRGESLRDLLKRSEQVKQRRAKQIIKVLLPRQSSLWNDEEEQEEADLLQVVSCGLFCGK